MTDKESPTEVTVTVNLPAHTSGPHAQVAELKSVGIAYLLWVCAGAVGAHRFYLGRRYGVAMAAIALVGIFTVPILIGLIPLAILGIWVLVDAVSIPGWVEESRATALAARSASVQPAPSIPAGSRTPSLPPAPPPARPGSLRTQLLKAAMDRKGVLTVTEGVIATGKSFKEVEACLQRMVDSGYVDVDNRPGSGVITYVFAELRD